MATPRRPVVPGCWRPATGGNSQAVGGMNALASCVQQPAGAPASPGHSTEGSPPHPPCALRRRSRWPSWCRRCRGSQTGASCKRRGKGKVRCSYPRRQTSQGCARVIQSGRRSENVEAPVRPGGVDVLEKSVGKGVLPVCGADAARHAGAQRNELRTDVEEGEEVAAREGANMSGSSQHHRASALQRGAQRAERCRVGRACLDGLAVHQLSR